MKKMIYIALLKVKLTFKDKAAFIWMFLAPLIFVTVLVFGFGSGESKNNDVKYPVSIVDNDNGRYSMELVNMIKNDKTFQVTECDYTKAKQDVENSKIAMGIVIPKDFSKFMEEGKIEQLEVLKLRDNETTMAITPVINNYTYQLLVGTKASGAVVSALSSQDNVKGVDADTVRDRFENSFMKNISSPKISYEVIKVVKSEKIGLDGLSYTAIGILIIFIMFFVMSGAGSILEEKELGTWKRVSSTPTSNYSILGGYILGTFILGWIQVGFLILVSRYVFHINWGNSLLGLILLFSSFLLSIIGLGAALSSFVKSKAQLSTLSPIIIMPTCLVAGCLWPKEIMPEIMLKVSNFVPQTWVLNGMTDLIARGSDINAVLFPSAVLIIFTCIFFIAGLTLMNFQTE